MSTTETERVTCPGCGAEIPGADRTATNQPIDPNTKHPFDSLPFEHKRRWCVGCGGSAVRLGPTFDEVEALSLIAELRRLSQDDLTPMFNRLERSVKTLAMYDKFRPKGA